MKLVVVHYHLRPGGIRRIIELAVPHLVREAPRPITRVVLATGQSADSEWHAAFEKSLPGIAVEVAVEPTLHYLSEQKGNKSRITHALRCFLHEILASSDHEEVLVWAHNLGVGRNLILSRELVTVCVRQNARLVAHQHDWWFDNRWARWPEMSRFGFSTMPAAAEAVFPREKNIIHAAINHADSTILERHFGARSLWLPNLTEPSPPVSAARMRRARGWLTRRLAGRDAPVWILPCRSLRRKNIAEALLLTRWLRPEAWLVVTGAASSADELPYYLALEQAARQHHWHFRIGILGGNEKGKPSVCELLAASEAVLLTSIQEGFGLPYLEAAASSRPLIARRLPNISPDLDRFGFRFQQSYDDILIAPELFDWKSERQRQHDLFRQWRANMPRTVQTRPDLPLLLKAECPCPQPFSRLTLAAQLEILRHPAHASWAACAVLNPFLQKWKRQASAGSLKVTAWPRSARQWLGGREYAQRFFAGLEEAPLESISRWSPNKVQADFIASKLSASNLYPLLWSNQT